MSKTRVMWLGLFLGLAVTPVWPQIEPSGLRPMPRPGGAPDTAVAPIEIAAVPVAVDALSSKSPTPRPVGLMKGREMRRALFAAQQGDWAEAAAIARGEGPVAVDIIEWQRLRKGEGSFAAYRDFLAKNAGWPGLVLLRKRGEASIGDDVPNDLVIAYFVDVAPQTGQGSLRLAAALTALGQTTRAEAEIVRAWTGMELSEAEEAAFLTAHGSLLRKSHVKRLDYLLWEGDRAAAMRMLPRVNADWQALARARLALQGDSAGVDKLIAAVPAGLAGDAGLAHDRMRWRVSKRLRTEAADMIIERSSSVADLAHPENWANWRRILARQEMREGNPQRAYALASLHRLKSGTDYADLEWLAGYLSLTYLKNPGQALRHFRNFETAVFTPISLGRAGYWQGRAQEALGDTAAANAAYSEAAKYQTSFYGLLAAQKMGVPMDTDLTGGMAQPDAWRGAAFTQSRLFAAANLFFEADQVWETGWFLRKLAESLDPVELVKLTDYVLSLNDPYLAVRVSKRAASAGTVAPRAYFPLPLIGTPSPSVPEALTLAIARRESEFYAAAISGAGARGLMQLMPGTAKQMATTLGLPYSRARLTSDPAYNAQLGTAYLARLIEEFGENYVLVAVGYNAGPSRARQWIKDFGDPRDPGVDVVDWIEHIPFRETRNYVMRVTESLPVYRARLSGQVEPIRLLAELKAR